MGSMDIEKLFEKISDGAAPYTDIVHKTLHNLWIGSAGVEASKIELTLTATVLINEICSYNDLPPSEIVIAEDALPLSTTIKGSRIKNEIAIHEEDDDIIIRTTGGEEEESHRDDVSDVEEFLLPPEEVMCPVVDTDKPMTTNVIKTLVPNPKICVRPSEELPQDQSQQQQQQPALTEYLCNVCKTLIPTYEKVLRHCTSRHPGEKVPILKLLHGGGLQSGPNNLVSSSDEGVMVFQCMSCEIDFKSEAELKEHVLAHDVLSKGTLTEGSVDEEENEKIEEVGNSVIHVEDKVLPILISAAEYKCHQCDRVFATQPALKKHSSSSHPKNDTPYECAKCNKKFRHCSSYLRHKMYSHGTGGTGPGGPRPKPYKCTTCDKAWMYKYLLEEHNRIVHQGLKSVYSCEKCGKGFGRANNLKKHMNTVHATSFDFVCDYCGKAYPIKQYLRAHIRDFHSDIPSVQELLENSRFKYKGPHDAKASYKRPEPKKRFECDKCDKKFTHRSLLECHNSNVHDGIKPYCCHLCGKSISTRANLKLHISRHDENRPKFVCELCGKEFLNKQTLKEHVTFTHEKAPKEKNFSCLVCGRKFWLKKELNKHVKLVHNKIFDYKCDICGRPFGTGTHLKTHKKTVHDKIHEYKCHLCPVEYGHQQSLKKHLEAIHDITDYMPPKKKIA